MDIGHDIVNRLAKDDKKAFEQLYFISFETLCLLATRYVYCPELAKEIVNDVLLNVWHNRKALYHPIQPYLIRSIKNRCYNHFRNKCQDEIHLSDNEFYLMSISKDSITSDIDPLRFIENKEIAIRIEAAVDMLPEKCRDIFIQYLYYNKTYEEIALMKNITSSTVRVQIKIALSKLRILLGDIAPLFFILIYFEKN